jgi:hypothetical protein
LRKLGAQRCAEAGASEHQLMALFGWANPKQAAVYTKKASRAKLEAAAAPLLYARSSNAAGADSNAAAERDSNKSVPLFATPLAGSGPSHIGGEDRGKTAGLAHSGNPASRIAARASSIND